MFKTINIYALQFKFPAAKPKLFVPSIERIYERLWGFMFYAATNLHYFSLLLNEIIVQTVADTPKTIKEKRLACTFTVMDSSEVFSKWVREPAMIFMFSS